jgi:hypothetical protein
MGAGLRIGEAMALTDRHLEPDRARCWSAS